MNVDRPISEKTRGEIENKIKNMGDYVKLSYLQRALKSGLDYDTKKFVLLKLSNSFEERKMFLEAAKTIKLAAEINTTFKDKIKDFMKAVELYIRAGDYIESDRIFSQSLALGNSQEKFEMKAKRKSYYMAQGKELISKDKRNQAKQIYEKTLTMDLDIGERQEIQKTLLELYNKLGNIREYYTLKDKM